jgi:aminopeptidase N
MGKIVHTLFCLFLYLSAVAQESEHPCALVHKNTKHAAPSQKTLTAVQEESANRYDVTFYDLNLQMTNQNTSVSGTAIMHGKVIQAVDSLVLELYSSMTISELKLNNVVTTYNRTGSVLTVPINQSVGSSFELSITYSGIPPTPNTNPFGGSGVTCSTVTSINDKVTWTVSCPFLAHEWFPCKQILRDKVDSCAVTLTVPSNCFGTSNGMLQSTTDNGNGTKTFSWRHRRPILYYLICASIAPYTEYTVYAYPQEMAGDSIPIQNFIYGNATGLNQATTQCDLLPEFLEHYSTLFGLYPFHEEKYGQCVAPLGGGMEHQTMTTIGVFDKRITAHELAHSWWGDYVGIASFSDVWLSEGFATYAEYLMLEEFYPTEKAALVAGWHNSVTSAVGGSVYHTDTLNISRIYSSRLSYKKGASIIHTLRHIIHNDSLFFITLRNFLQQYPDGVAKGVDLRDFFESTLSIDLHPYFNEWYFGEGFPTYSTRRNIVGNDLLIEINHSVSMPAVTPTFTNPLELKLSRSNATDTTIRFEITSNTNQFLLSGLANVTDVAAVDPNNWIINRFGLHEYDPTLTLGITNNEENPVVFNIYPNPTTSKITATFSGLEPGTKTQLILFDMKGKELLCSQTDSDSLTVDTSNLASGCYLVLVQNSFFREIKKICKD